MVCYVAHLMEHIKNGEHVYVPGDHSMVLPKNIGTGEHRKVLLKNIGTGGA